MIPQAVAPEARQDAFEELERAVLATLETYSNVHRGSGHASLVSTLLYERAREIVLDHLGLPASRHTVIFCTPRRAEALEAQVGPDACRSVSSRALGLPLGVVALAVETGRLPAGPPAETGGGTARLVGPDWTVWARAAGRFEPGTPAIVNVVALAKALLLLRRHGAEAFRESAAAPLGAAELVRRDELEALSGPELLERLRRTTIGRGLQVPTAKGAAPYVNLDNGASTPAFAPVFSTFRQALRLPRAAHEQLVREVRSVCAEVLGAPAGAYEVVFTANTTEAIHLAAASLRREPADGFDPVVVNTVLEHNSNELPWRHLPGFAVVRMPVDAEGFLDLEALEAVLRDHARGLHGRRRVRLVAVSGASNVLGACNDLAAVARVAHRHGARLLVDAAQLVAHRAIDVEGSGIDYLAFSAHKAYAPFGAGALVARRGLLAFPPDERERIDASGEENVAGIAALGKALVLLRRVGLDVIQREERALTARLLRGLSAVPGVTVHGTKDPDSPRLAEKGAVVVFDVKAMTPGRVGRELAERRGIGIRTGCHCAHLLIKRMLGIPRPIERFQRLIVTLFPRLELPGVARVSLGLENDAEDVDTLLEVLAAVARRQPVEGTRPGEVRRSVAAFAEERVREVYGA